MVGIVSWLQSATSPLDATQSYTLFKYELVGRIIFPPAPAPPSTFTSTACLLTRAWGSELGPMVAFLN